MGTDGILGSLYLGRADQMQVQGWAQAKSEATGLHYHSHQNMLVIVHAVSLALWPYAAIAARVSVERTRKRQALN